MRWAWLSTTCIARAPLVMAATDCRPMQFIDVPMGKWQQLRRSDRYAKPPLIEQASHPSLD